MKPRADQPARRRKRAAAGGQAWRCPSCGETSGGEFCPACGERRPDGRDLSLRGFLADSFRTVTNLDSAAARSFRALLTRPGLLTAEYVAGRRRPYVSPLQLFLFCNVAFFFVQAFTGLDSFTTPLRVHMHGLPYRELAERLVDAEVARRGIALEEYARAFDRTIAQQARTLVIVMVPLFAVLVQAVGRRGRFFVESLAFSFHFYAFLMLLVSGWGLFLAVAVRVVGALGGDPAELMDDNWNSLVLGLGMAGYLYAALRRAHGSRALPAALRAGVLAYGVLGVLQCYRLILFFTAYLSV